MFALRATQNSPPSPVLVERIVAHTKLPSAVQFSPGRAPLSVLASGLAALSCAAASVSSDASS